SLVGGISGEPRQVRANRALVSRALRPYGTIRFRGDAEIALLERLLPLLRRLRGWLLDRFLKAVAGYPLEVLELGPELHRLYQGNPSDVFVRHAYFKSRTPKPSGVADPPGDACGLIWFAPIAPM